MLVVILEVLDSLNFFELLLESVLIIQVKASKVRVKSALDGFPVSAKLLLNDLQLTR